MPAKRKDKWQAVNRKNLLGNPDAGGEKFGCRVLVGGSIRHSQNDCFQFIFVDFVSVDTVNFQKYQGGVSPNAFVAIDEAVILREMKQIRGGHFRQGL